MIRSLPLTALSLMLGFFFVFVGVLKISPSVNADIYKHMVCFFYVIIYVQKIVY
jgi:hypothetical protein